MDQDPPSFLLDEKLRINTLTDIDNMSIDLLHMKSNKDITIEFNFEKLTQSIFVLVDTFRDIQSENLKLNEELNDLKDKVNIMFDCLSTNNK